MTTTVTVHTAGNRARIVFEEHRSDYSKHETFIVPAHGKFAVSVYGSATVSVVEIENTGNIQAASDIKANLFSREQKSSPAPDVQSNFST